MDGLLIYYVGTLSQISDVRNIIVIAGKCASTQHSINWVKQKAELSQKNKQKKNYWHHQFLHIRNEKNTLTPFMQIKLHEERILTVTEVVCVVNGHKHNSLCQMVGYSYTIKMSMRKRFT